MVNPNKPSIFKRTAVAATASLGLLAGATLAEAPAKAEAATIASVGNTYADYLGAILRTHANLRPKVVFSVLKLCNIFPSNCYLQALPNQRYQVKFNGLKDPKTSYQSYDAGYSGSFAKGPDSFWVYKFDNRSEKLINRDLPEGLCSPDPDSCNNRVATVDYGQAQIYSSVGGLGLATPGSETMGNFYTSYGNHRNYIQNSAGAEFLAIAAVNNFAEAAKL